MFGHLSGLPDNGPAKHALYEAKSSNKTQRKTTNNLAGYYQKKKKQLKEIGFYSIYDAIKLIRNDSKLWQHIVQKL